MRKAIITGIAGQDGSYLAEFLLSKGYEVHGIIRRASVFNTQRIDHIFEKLHLHHGDITDPGRMFQLVSAIEPDEVYNLAAQSHVAVSFENPIYSCQCDAMGALNMLEAVRSFRDKSGKNPRYYQASTSEMFGNATEPIQSETTPFKPCSPYGCAKLFAHQITVNYREAYGLHASCGILFNHESPRRGETFVTRKITRAVGRIKAGLQDKLVLGNPYAMRDWGWAQDYCQAMWMMLQRETPRDYVVATGISRSVEDFCRTAFDIADLDWNEWVSFDDKYKRPSELQELCGDSQKIRRELGWKPTVDIDELTTMMVEHDIELAKRESRLGA